MSADNQQLEKIARMAAFEISQAQIARALGLTEGRISQIVETDEYKNVLASISTEYFEQNQSLNDGWDTLEANALNNLLTNLAWNRDPEFALRAAAVANKANRRGDVSNRTIDGQTGARAIFHLTTHFIEKLQQNFYGSENGKDKSKENGTEKLVQKQSDFMVPERVEKLFVKQDNKKTDSNALLDFFPEQHDMVPAE